jgi:methionyl-tRNA formyltransferase
MLESIIVISPKHFHDHLAGTLRAAKENLTVYCVDSLIELMLLDKDLHAKSRLISFLNSVIVPAFTLKKMKFGAINFHPGTPCHPGYAPYSFALYEGAQRHGITVHEMVEKVDAGRILALDFFAIELETKQAQLVNLCIESSKQLLAKLAPILVRETLPPYIDYAWGPHKFKRAQFAEYCALPADISKTELQRRIRAFGAGDSELCLYVWHEGKKYLYQEACQAGTNDDCLELYGNTFKAVDALQRKTPYLLNILEAYEK